MLLYHIFLPLGTFLFPRQSPFGLWSALWLDLLSGMFSGEGAFLFSPHPRERLSKRFWGTEGEVFLQVIRLQGFSWYDFASFDDSSSAKLGQFYRRIRGWGEFLKVALLFFLRRVSKENRARGSVCGSKNDITESVHNKISLERALEKFKGTSWNSSPPRIFL